MGAEKPLPDAVLALARRLEAYAGDAAKAKAAVTKSGLIGPDGRLVLAHNDAGGSPDSRRAAGLAAGTLGALYRDRITPEVAAERLRLEAEELVDKPRSTGQKCRGQRGVDAWNEGPDDIEWRDVAELLEGRTDLERDEIDKVRQEVNRFATKTKQNLKKRSPGRKRGKK